MGRPRIYASATERTRAWRARNPERNAEHNRRSIQKWRSTHPERDAAAREAERLAYGVTSDGLAELETAQGGRCAICGTTPSGRRLAIDHDHTTGKVRGLLCGSCNTGLGLLGDTAEGIEAALRYLRGAS